MKIVRNCARNIWSWIRQVSGDAAYENYLRHASASGTGSKILSRQEYYLDVLRRRYSGVSRCC